MLILYPFRLTILIWGVQTPSVSNFSGWGTQWRDGVYSMIKLKQACDAASNPRRPRNLFLQTNARWSFSVSSHDPFTACFVWWQNPPANFDWRVVSMYQEYNGCTLGRFNVLIEFQSSPGLGISSWRTQPFPRVAVRAHVYRDAQWRRYICAFADNK